MSLSNHIVNDRLVFGGFSSKQDYLKLIGIWQSISNKKGNALSTEMVDYIRSKQAVVDSMELGAFPTLDISSCRLEDETALCLVESLAMRPSIAKLDLSDCEVSHKLVDVLLRLLRGQAKLVRSVGLDDRLQLALLGEVAMAVEPSDSADHDALQELSLLSNALNFANAQVLIRSLYKRKRLVEPICAAHVHLIWTQVMGDIVQEELESAYAAASLFEHVHSALNYSEMESMLLCGLIDRGVLAVLNDWQMSAIGFSPQWLQHYHQHAVETVLSSYSRTTTITASPRSPRTPRSIAASVPVVQVEIPEVELDSSQDCEEEEVREVDVVEDVIAEALHSLQRSGSRHSVSANKAPSPAVASPSPPITPTTASLFTAKYLQRSIRAEKNASAALASPTSSSKPAVCRPRSSVLAAPSTQPPMRSPAQVSNHIQHGHGETLSSTAPSPASTAPVPDPSELLYIRYDKIKALQQGRGDTLPHLSPLLAPHLPYEYRDGASTAEGECVYSNLRFTPRDADSIEGDDVYSASAQQYSISEHRRHSFTGSEGDLLPPSSPPVQSAFALDLQAFAQAPGKLNVLTVCNVSHSDAELANLLGWPKNRRHPVTVLILRNNNIAYPEHLNLAARFESLLDLDLSFNHIAGAVKGLPRSLQRLDLSHNRITNITSLADCVGLVEVNIAHNNVKSFHALPPRLERLDLSHNVIASTVTLRTLALSPDIKSLDLSGNPVLIEITDWKVVISALLPRLHELNGKPLFAPRKSTERRPAPPKQPTTRSSPLKQPVPPRASSPPRRVSAREQLVNDAVRMHSDMTKFEILEEARREYADRFRNRSVVLQPHEVQQLTERLTAPTKAFKLRSSALFSPPRLFTEKDLIRRRHPPPTNRGNSSQPRENRANPDRTSSGYGATKPTRKSHTLERERVNFYSDPAYYTADFQDQRNEYVSSVHAREVAEDLQNELPAVTESVLNGTDSASPARDSNADGLLLPPPVPTHPSRESVPNLSGFMPIPPGTSQYEHTLAAAAAIDSGRQEDISQNSLGSAAMSPSSIMQGASDTPSPSVAMKSQLGSYASAASMVSINPSELSEADQVYQDDTADTADQLQHSLCLVEEDTLTGSLTPALQDTADTTAAALITAPSKVTEQPVQLPEAYVGVSEAGREDAAVVGMVAPQGIAEAPVREEPTPGTQSLAGLSSAASSVQGGGDSQVVLVGEERSYLSLSTAADPPSRASATPTAAAAPRQQSAPLTIITAETELNPQRIMTSDSPLLTAVTSPLTEPDQPTPMSRAGSIMSTDFGEDGSSKLSARERLQARLAKNKK